MFNHPFKISLFFAIPMFILVIGLKIVGNSAENNLVDGFKTPVIAFEFIQSEEEVAEFFNVNLPNLYRIDFMLVNNLDYFFMFFYAAFLGFTGIGIARETKMKIMWLPVALTVIIFLSDLFENLTMATIVNNYFNHQTIENSNFGNLNFFTWLKWGSIAAVIFIYGSYFLKGKLLGKIISFVAFANFIMAIFAFFHRSVFNEIMSTTVALSFLLIFIHNLSFNPNKVLEK